MHGFVVWRTGWTFPFPVHACVCMSHSCSRCAFHSPARASVSLLLRLEECVLSDILSRLAHIYIYICVCLLPFTQPFIRT